MPIPSDPAEMTGHKGKSSQAEGWLMWGLAAFFYLLGFFQRVAPAVMTRELMADFSIGASSLGHLSAFYYYSYMALQIPSGILTDTWGPRRLLLAGSVLMAAGSLIFGLTDNIGLAYLGRFLIGAASATAFVSALKAASLRLPANLFACVSGLTLLSGVVGAVGAGAPLRLLVDQLGWRATVLATGALSLALALAIRRWFRETPADRRPAGQVAKEPSRPLRGIAEIFRYRNTWVLFLAPGGIVGPLLAFSGLWGVPYLRARFGLGETAAATLCSALLVGWATAGPLMGWLSDRLGRRKAIYTTGCFVAALGWLLVVGLPEMGLGAFVSVMVVVSLATGVMVLGFAYGRESVPARLSGTMTGALNMGVMLGPTLVQPIIGYVLDSQWLGETIAGVRVYPLESYRLGFAAVMVWTVLSGVFLSLSRETRRQARQ